MNDFFFYKKPIVLLFDLTVLLLTMKLTIDWNNHWTLKSITKTNKSNIVVCYRQFKNKIDVFKEYTKLKLNKGYFSPVENLNFQLKLFDISYTRFYSYFPECNDSKMASGRLCELESGFKKKTIKNRFL